MTRREVLIVAGLLVVAASVPTLAQQRPKAVAEARELRTRELTLVDAQGRIRAMLGCEDSGDPRFSLITESGKPLVTIGLAGENTALIGITNVDTKHKVAMALLDGKPHLGISGDSVISLGFDEKGRPNIEIVSPNGKPLFQAVR